jgi:hypothetical protein
VGDNVDEATSRRGFTGQPNLVFSEGHLDLGGPIKRDATWFYVAYNHFRIDKVISGVSREVATDLGDFDAFTSKVTQRLSQRDTLVGYYQWSQKLKPFRGLSNLRGPDTILAQDSASWMMNAQYQRVWSNRLFTDLKVGTFGFGWPMKPAIDWRTAPPRIDLATNAESGAGWLAGSAGGPFSFDRRKPQVALTATYFLPARAGSHDIKVGMEWLDDQSKFANNGASGPVLYRDRGGLPSEVRLTDVGTLESLGKSWTGADDRNRRLAVFFQDRWTPVSRLTLSLGVRYDSQRPHYEDSIRQPVLSDVFPAQTSPKRTLLRSRQTVARLGASYDLLGDGKSVLKAFYGRFYFNFADRLSAVNPGGTNRRDYVFNDVNGNRLYDGVHELGTLLASAGGTSTTLDPDLKTPYTDEIDLSFERQFWGESSLRAAYVRKMSRDEFGTYNPFREGRYTVPTDVTVSLQSFDGGVEGPRTLRLFDIPAGIPVRNIVATFPASVGGGSFNFDTVQLAFTKRFANGLFVQSSYEYQWRDELRDPNNISTSPLVADPIATGYHQNTHAQGAQGVSNRQRSTNWNYRLLGRYVLPSDVGVATNLRVQSGWPYGRVITLRLPNAGSTNFFETPIRENRSDLAALVDIRVDRSFRAGRYRFTLMGDVFNLLNSNAVTNFNLTNGSRFNQIIATLDPRTAMVGIRFEF